MKVTGQALISQNARSMCSLTAGEGCCKIFARVKWGVVVTDAAAQRVEESTPFEASWMTFLMCSLALEIVLLLKSQRQINIRE